jgi:hypothetical protein
MIGSFLTKLEKILQIFSDQLKYQNPGAYINKYNLNYVIVRGADITDVTGVTKLRQ